jgi:cardiolipin synthase
MPNEAVKKADTSWQFFLEPQKTWDAMYQDCSQAKKSIEFEQYILENDAVGRRFMELFTQKAKEGLKIFVICDRFGSSLLYRSKWVRKLRRHGGRLYFYNPLSKWMILTPWRWFPRTHTKTLLIDSAIAYTGGVCIAERMRHWRDTHIRVTGPVVSEIREAFDDIENRILQKKSKGIPVVGKDRPFRYILNRPLQRRGAVYKELVKAVQDANHYIYITSAFFIPNRRLLRELKAAHDRGVDVRVLVPGHSDVPMADWLCLSYTPRFFAAGLRIYHYQGTVLHSKTAIIDDSWGTVGSTNFDIISFFHNREGNIVTTDANAITEMKQQFFVDLEHSAELTVEGWKKVPLWKKAAGFAARILREFF